jgi:hypothetical protein
VEHQRIAVGIAEERHVADARVEDVAVELDPLGLELLARLGDVGTRSAMCA